jgi:hypothetical protein
MGARQCDGDAECDGFWGTRGFSQGSHAPVTMTIKSRDDLKVKEEWCFVNAPALVAGTATQ